MSNDNWGWRARVGMFIVGNEAVPEAEWWAMAPKGVSVHAARVTARAPWSRWNAERTSVALEDDLARGAKQFAAMKLSAVTIGHSSSSMMGGAGWLCGNCCVCGARPATMSSNSPGATTLKVIGFTLLLGFESC